MEYRILGNQPEPTLTRKDMYISDFEMRHKSQVTWRKGVALVNEFCSANPEFEGDFWMTAQEAKEYGMIDEVLIRK